MNSHHIENILRAQEKKIVLKQAWNTSLIRKVCIATFVLFGLGIGFYYASDFSGSDVVFVALSLYGAYSLTSILCRSWWVASHQSDEVK